MIEWSNISDKMFSYTRRVLDDEGIHTSDEEIKEAIIIFENLIKEKTSYFMLDGFSSQVFPALQEACITQIGQVGPLRKLLDSADSFMKRLLIFSGRKTYAEVEGRRITFMKLFEMSGVEPSFSVGAGVPQDIDTLHSNPNGLYIFAWVYQARNNVHNTPDWLDSDVTNILKYALAFYIWMTHRMKTDLLTHYPNFVTPNFVGIDPVQLNEQMMLCDSIRYSSSINDVKNKLVRAFITATLLDEGELPIYELLAKTNQKLESKFNEKKFKRQLDTLVNQKALVYNVAKTHVSITEQEKKSLQKLKSDLAANRNFLLDETSKLLSPYHLESHAENVMGWLLELYEKNCKKSLTGDPGDNIQDLDEIKDSLKDIGVPEEEVTSFVLSLVELCKTNNYISNLAVSKTISNLSVIELDNANAERTIYVDTQVILHLLCLNKDMPIADSPHSRIIKAFSEIPYAKNNLSFCFAEQYLKEVYGHIEAAVALIPIVDSKYAINECMSSNVFYQHYYTLRDEIKLPEGVDSFSEYLDYQFNLRYDDFVNHKVHNVAKSAVYKKLRELHIEPTPLPRIPDDSVSYYKAVYQRLIEESGLRWNKTLAQLDKDAIMGGSLFEESRKAIMCPFLITQDFSFFAFRKKYLEEVERNAVASWRGFTPAKFVNHIDLNELKIKEGSLTNDIIAMIKSDSEEVSKTFFDALNKLTSNRDMSQKTREKLQRSLLEINKNSKEEDEEKRILLARAMDQVYDYFKQHNLWQKLSTALEDEGTTKIFIDALVAASSDTNFYISEFYHRINELIELEDKESGEDK